MLFLKLRGIMILIDKFSGGETVTTGRRKLKLGEVRPRNDHVIQFLAFPVMFDQQLRSWLVWADPFRPFLSGCHALSISPIPSAFADETPPQLTLLRG